MLDLGSSYVLTRLPLSQSARANRLAAIGDSRSKLCHQRLVVGRDRDGHLLHTRNELPLLAGKIGQRNNSVRFSTRSIERVGAPRYSGHQILGSHGVVGVLDLGAVETKLLGLRGDGHAYDDCVGGTVGNRAGKDCIVGERLDRGRAAT